MCMMFSLVQRLAKNGLITQHWYGLDIMIDYKCFTTHVFVKQDAEVTWNMHELLSKKSVFFCFCFFNLFMTCESMYIRLREMPWQVPPDENMLQFYYK